MGGSGSKRFTGLPLNQFLYAFGLSENKPVIIKYDAKTKALSKVTPPTGMELFEHSKAVWVNDNAIFICGGVNYDKKVVSKKSYLYIPSINKLEELGDMITGRFAHMVTIHNGDVYVAGGRTAATDKQDDYFLVNAEKLAGVGALAAQYELKVKKDKKGTAQKVSQDPNTKPKWAELSSLNAKRCDGSLLVIKDKIYCFGGIEENGNRAELIESLDPKNATGGKWNKETVEFGLGTEGTQLLQASASEVLFFGGQDDFHRTRFWGSFKFQTGLEQSTYTVEGEMGPRNLPKVVYFKDGIHIVGGNAKGNIEVIDIKTKKVVEKKPTAGGDIKVDWTSLCFSASPVNVNFSQAALAEKPVKWNKDDGPQHLHVFGNDNHPTFLTYNRATGKILNKGLPLSLRQFSYSTACKLNDKDVFFFGGCSFDLLSDPNFIADSVYHVDVSTGKGKKLPGDLPRPLTNASSAKTDDNKIIITGGRYYTPEYKLVNNGDTYLFDPTKGTFSNLAPLTIPRWDHSSIFHNGALYVFGGRDANGGCLDSIEKLNVQANKWEVTKFKLDKPLARVASYKNKEEVFLVGGETASGAPCQEISVLDLKTETIICHGKLGEAREAVKLYQDKKGTVGVYGGENFKSAGETITETKNPKPKKPEDAVKVTSKKDGAKNKLATALDEYFKKNSTDIVLIS